MIGSKEDGRLLAGAKSVALNFRMGGESWSLVTLLSLQNLRRDRQFLL